MANLNGKVALVTGASKGIGAGIARELARQGASVAINYSRDKAAAEAIVAEIKSFGGNAIAVSANVADPASAEPMVATVAKQLGPIDVLVNNAGAYELAPLEQVTPEHFHKLFDLNVLGLLMVTQAALRKFSPSGGSIINLGSVASRTGLPPMIVYTATKGAINVITSSLAKELGPRKIRVNTVSPGLVETEGSHAVGAVGSDFQKFFESNTALGRIAQPLDIGKVAAFLASDDSAWVNGQLIHVDGGFFL